MYQIRVGIMVPVAGLEPARCRQRWILSPLRLPFHHTGRCYALCRYNRFFLLQYPTNVLGLEKPSSLVDRCHSLRSLHPPPAALPSLPLAGNAHPRCNDHSIPDPYKKWAPRMWSPFFGAGYGNRTRLHGLGSRCITDIRTLQVMVLYQR